MYVYIDTQKPLEPLGGTQQGPTLPGEKRVVRHQAVVAQSYLRDICTAVDEHHMAGTCTDGHRNILTYPRNVCVSGILYWTDKSARQADQTRRTC